MNAYVRRCLKYKRDDFILNSEGTYTWKSVFIDKGE